MLSAISQAWHSWRTSKGIALMAAVALAVGIGSTTAIYTVVNAVLLKPLLYPHSERFVALYSATTTKSDSYGAHSFRDLQTYQERTRSFDLFGIYRLDDFNLTAPGAPQHVHGAFVTPDFAGNLGINPIVGRWFTDAGGAVISAGLWNRLGGTPDIVGKTIVLSGRGYAISGVMPPQFRLPLVGVDFQETQNEVWIGLDVAAAERTVTDAFYLCYARMKPGVTFAQAEQDVKRVAAEIAAENPASHPGYTARVDTLRDTVVRGIRPTLLLLFAASALLLAITAANVAGLMLSRSAARARETAIRLSLGANLRQLLVSYLAEALVVALAGAAAGVVLSIAVVRFVIRTAGDYVPMPDRIGVDWSVVVFAALIAGLAGTLASLAPLWHAAKTAPNDVLNDGTRSSAGARSRRLSRSLVSAEIALAFALLALSGVLIMNLRNLGRSFPGFDARGLMTFAVTIDNSVLSDDGIRDAKERGLIRALETVPGVAAAAISNHVPLAGCCLSTTIYPEGSAPGVDVTLSTSFVAVSPGFFQTMRIPLHRGRLLNDADANSTLVYTVVNESAAKHFWPDRDAVGAFGRFNRPDGSRFQVVGVIGDVANEGLGRPVRPEIYVPASITAFNPVYCLVRSSLPEEILLPGVRKALSGFDPALSIHDIATMDQIEGQSVTFERIASFMTSFFATSALLMAMLGIHGVVAYSVRQRTVELGTRLALGASGRNLIVLVFSGALKMTLFGVASGSILSVAATYLLIRALNIHNVGMMPFVSSTALVGGVALCASAIPAWRATLVSPMVALRNEPRSTWRSARDGFFDAIRSLSQTVASLAERDPVLEETVLTQFTEAARLADSSTHAVQIALTTLCRKLGSESGLLFERVSAEECRCVAIFPERDCDMTLRLDGVLFNRLRFSSSPLPLTGADIDAWRQWAAEHAPQHIHHIDALKRADARIAVALRIKSDITGLLLLGKMLGRDRYTADEKRVLPVSAQQFALMLENSRLTDRMVEQEKLRRDIALAAEVQKRLLPERAPHLPGGSLAALSIPARSVGGDYYDFFELGDHRVAFALADVAGKGIAAALIMSCLQACLRMICLEENVGLPELAARLNEFLHRTTPSNSYATFFYAQIDSSLMRLRYVNAGHNPPFLLRNESEILELQAGGTVVGLLPMMTYPDAVVDLQPGDALIAFTDGVTEALNPEGEEFGELRLKDALRRSRRGTASAIAESIRDELRAWIRTAEQHDDMTLVVIKLDSAG